MSTLKTISVIHPSGATTNITNDASGNVTVGNNLTVSGTGVMNIGSGQIYKDSSGNVGIGTGSPTVYGSYRTLEVRGTGGGLVQFGTGATTAAYLYQDGTNAGFTNIANGVMTFSTNNTERARIDSSGNWYMNSGYGSAAVAYGCRAWVNWQASSSTLRGYGGITSVTRNATGDYTINFSFTMPDTNYNATMMASKSALSSGSSNLMCIAENNAPTTTTLRVYNNPSNNGASTADAVYSCVSVFR